MYIKSSMGMFVINLCSKEKLILDNGDKIFDYNFIINTTASFSNNLFLSLYYEDYSKFIFNIDIF